MIFTATSAEEAIRIHRDERVDLVIADLEMGGMGGDGMCTAIRGDETLKKVSIIIYCFNKKSARERCEACGANACLTKPVNPEVLFQKVNDLLSICRRESLRVLIRVSVEGRAGDGYFFSTSKNISTTGILLETDKVLAKGDRITCSFFLNTNQITANGEAVRVEEKKGELNQYGVKFIDLAPDAQILIEEFIKKSRSR